MTDKVQKLGLSDEIRKTLIGGADMHSLTGTYGGVGDDATNNAAAIAAATAAGGRVYVPAGTFKTSAATIAALANSNLVGLGQVKTADGHKVAPDFTYLTTRPTAGGADNFSTAFDGDVSKCRPAAHLVSGSSTLGTDAGGYNFPAEACGHLNYMFVDGSAGANGLLSGAGRTGVAMHKINVGQFGGGDAYGVHSGGIAVNPSPLTILDPNKLIIPAIVSYAGDTVAGSHNVYLNNFETHAVDNGNRSSAAPNVVVLYRTQSDDSLDGAGGPAVHYWIGYSSQSDGSVASHVGYRLEGRWKHGFTTTEAQLDANLSAIALLPTHRIYFNAAVRTTGEIKIAGDPGTTYMHYASSALRLVVGGTERLNLTSTKLAVTGSRGGNAALASLLTQLAAMNLITDSSTA